MQHYVMPVTFRRWTILAGLLAITLCAGNALAATGKLLLTGGVSSIEGAAGGGISPWAVIGSNATDGELGITTTLSRARTQDYSLTSHGVAVGIHDRAEVSIARQDFDASPTLALNGIAPFGIRAGQHVQLDVLGVKLRVAGDAILDSDRAMSQISVGLQYKRVHAGSLASVLQFLGARHHGADVYISATKLLLEQGLLINGTLRSTRANQNGLLGFGAAAPGRDRRALQAEVSLALMLSPSLAVGLEFRRKPNNLEALGRAAGLGRALREQHWRDVFVAWAPNKHFSATLAWVDLGQILPAVTGDRRQTGVYLSGQLAY